MLSSLSRSPGLRNMNNVYSQGRFLSWNKAAYGRARNLNGFITDFTCHQLDEELGFLTRSYTTIIPPKRGSHSISLISEKVKEFLFNMHQRLRRIGFSRYINGRISDIGKARYIKVDKNTKDEVYFKDIVGCDEAKQDIMEYVDFLKNPNKGKELGVKIPKGILLFGPPGTGKTLLALATAFECGIPFFSTAGCDFMEMYAGVGPLRVRNLFLEARKCAPSIIFIDHIDVFGGARRRDTLGDSGNAERERTLSQLCSEMDGFESSCGVLVLAATNRPDVLDKCLLRPGRFDRHISTDNPDIKDREQLFKIYTEKMRFDREPSYDAWRLATLTPGLSSAQIETICNEAGLLVLRGEQKVLKMEHFGEAIGRITHGVGKKNWMNLCDGF